MIKDCFDAYQVKNAFFTKKYELTILENRMMLDSIPENIITLKEARSRFNKGDDISNCLICTFMDLKNKNKD